MQPACYSLGWDRQTDGRITVSPNAPIWQGGHSNLHQRHCHASARQTAETCACRRNLSRVPILLVTKNSRTFQDPGSIFPRPCRKPAMLKFLTAVSNHIYNMIAASILEYMFITVTCCEKIAKKLFEHFLWNRGERTHILASASA